MNANAQPGSEFQPLMDDIFREKVRRARAEKVEGVLSLAGFDLYASALAFIRDGVRAQLPEATEEEVRTEVERRLAIARRLDENGFYRPAA
jgi:Arc/MetJ-type ribon-helix-helix transcriptional regulator